jgi:hypothetical protein
MFAGYNNDNTWLLRKGALYSYSILRVQGYYAKGTIRSIGTNYVIG